MNIANTIPNEENIELAAVLAVMESGLINGVSFDAAKETLKTMTREQIKNFVESTQQRAQERR